MTYIVKPKNHHPLLEKNELRLTRRDYEGAVSTLCAGCGHDLFNSDTKIGQAVDGLHSMRQSQSLLRKMRIIVLVWSALRSPAVNVMGILDMFSMMCQTTQVKGIASIQYL